LQDKTQRMLYIVGVSGFIGSRRLKTRWLQKNQARRANREYKGQDFSQAELRQRLDREAKRAGFVQRQVLIKRNPGPEGCSVD